jgi:hypothetical protein
MTGLQDLLDRELSVEEPDAEAIVQLEMLIVESSDEITPV